MPLEVHSFEIEKVQYVCISSCIYYASRDVPISRDVYIVYRDYESYTSQDYSCILRCYLLIYSRDAYCLCILETTDLEIYMTDLDIHIYIYIYIYMHLDLKKHVLYYLKTMNLEFHIACTHSICIHIVCSYDVKTYAQCISRL